MRQTAVGTAKIELHSILKAVKFTSKIKIPCLYHQHGILYYNAASFASVSSNSDAAERFLSRSNTGLRNWPV